MAIEITIVNSPDGVNVGQSNQTFPDAGGTLGRGSKNFWVLDDPNKYMSSVHAQIALVGEQYILTDLSTNGTFVNGSAEPLGNGNQITLNEGDSFTISDYEFVAKVPNQNSLSSNPFGDFDKPMPSGDDFLPTSPLGNDPFATGVIQNDLPSGDLFAPDDKETDPLALLNNDPFAESPTTGSLFPQDNQNSNEFSPNDPDFFSAPTSTTIEDKGVGTDAVNWPSAKPEAGFIPDDWDDDDLMSGFEQSGPSPFDTPITPPAPVIPEIPAEPVTPFTPAEPSMPQAPVTPQVAISEDIPAVPSAPIMEPEPIIEPVFHAPVAEPIVPTAPNVITEKPSTSNTHSDADYAALELKNQQLQQEIAQLKQQLAQAKVVSPTASNSNDAATQSVVNAMGLARWNLDDKKVAEINDTVGYLMRETMQGMMRVLKFRKKIKEEFRINVTTIQSVENNPLKFSANVDDAMENMFIKENNAYKSPVDAVKEGFQGIAEHQVAVIAGMQAAFRGMIDRFDPNNLESRFEKYKSTSLLSLGQKGKRWNAYKQYHQSLIENLDDSFQHLFGYDFVQAYEAQMQHLISERLSAQDKETNESIT